MEVHSATSLYLLLPWLMIGLFLHIPAAISEEELTCARSDPPHLTVIERVTPLGNVSAGIYEKVDASSLASCVAECCERSSCEVVFYFNLSSCFLITCRRAELCQPLERTGDKFLFSVMVTVREPGLFGSTMDWDSFEKSSTFNYLEEEEDPRSCMFGMEEECPSNEVCRLKNHRTRQGLCVCQPGLERSQDTGHCLPQTEANTTSDMPQRLVVSAGDNVTIQLPDNSVTLSAYVLPKPPEGEKYNYEWKLLAHPDGDESGTMSDQNTDTLKLSKVSLG